MIILSNCCEHIAAQFSLPGPERRRGNVQYKISARTYQSIDWIDTVKSAVPEVFVIPRVLANCQSHLFAAKREQHLTACGRKVPHLVKNVVGRQQHFGLHELDLSVEQQRRRIHD